MGVGLEKSREYVIDFQETLRCKSAQRGSLLGPRLPQLSNLPLLTFPAPKARLEQPLPRGTAPALCGLGESVACGAGCWVLGRFARSPFWITFHLVSIPQSLL